MAAARDTRPVRMRRGPAAHIARVRGLPLGTIWRLECSRYLARNGSIVLGLEPGGGSRVLDLARLDEVR